MAMMCKGTKKTANIQISAAFFQGNRKNMADKERTIINKTGDVADKGSAKGCEKEIPEFLQKNFSF